MSTGDPDAPLVHEVDENGVDLAQIRFMLSLTPEQRLRRVEAIVEDMRQIWQRNGTRPLR